MTHTMRFVPAAIWLLASTAAAVAEARPRIIVLETDAGISMDALTAQLRLHVGELDLETRPRVDPVPDRKLATATALVVARHDTVVIWIETLPPPGGFVAYAVGPWPDRTPVELVRLEAVSGAHELVRVVALKVASRLDLHRGRARSRELAAPAATPWRLSVGTSLVHADPGLTGGMAVATERVVAAGQVQLRLGGRGRWHPVTRVDAAAARTTLHEVSAAATVVAGLAHERWELFGATAAGAALIAASATTPDLRTGARTVVVPSLSLGVGVRAPLSGSAGLVLEAGYERWLLRQRFIVDQQVAADLGNARVYVGLSVSIPIP